MKIYKSNYENIKWYKQIDWIKLLISFIVLAFLLTLAFNYLGKGKDLERAIKTSMLISSLIGIAMVLSDLYNNKTIILIDDKKELKYIDLHDGKDGKYISNLEYENIIENVKPTEIYDKIEKYEGVDSGIIKDILKVRKTNNCIIVTANVKEKTWKAYGHFSITKMEIKEKEYKKKIKIMNDFQDYEKIYEILLKKCI